MPDDLIAFWGKCKLDRSPHVHPEDLPVIQKFGCEVVEDKPARFRDFVIGPDFGRYDHRLNLNLLPVPYSGDLRNAEIVVLLLNPGFTLADYWGEFEIPKLRQRLVATLQQSTAKSEFPFMWLDPEFCWHGGFIWWEKKLRDVVRVIAQEFGWRYFDALRDLSKKLACLQLIPYHSPSFGAHKLIKQLPSALKAREFVENSLHPDAKIGKRTLIITRQTKAWNVPRGENIKNYDPRHARGSSLSPESDGGKAILLRYHQKT